MCETWHQVWPAALLAEDGGERVQTCCRLLHSSVLRHLGWKGLLHSWQLRRSQGPLPLLRVQLQRLWTALEEPAEGVAALPQEVAALPKEVAGCLHNPDSLEVLTYQRPSDLFHQSQLQVRTPLLLMELTVAMNLFCGVEHYACGAYASHVTRNPLLRHPPCGCCVCAWHCACWGRRIQHQMTHPCDYGACAWHYASQAARTQPLMSHPCVYDVWTCRTLVASLVLQFLQIHQMLLKRSPVQIRCLVQTHLGE